MFLAVVQANNTVTVDELEKIRVSSELRYGPITKAVEEEYEV